MKLLTLLTALRPDEHRDFEKFLQSPFFKASDQYLAFFKHLRRHHPGFEVGREGREAAYRRCFGAKSFTEYKLHNLMSGTARQVEQYLAVKQVTDPQHGHDSPLQRALLVKALGERNMDAYFRAEAERHIEEAEASPIKSQDDYLAMQQLHHEVYFNPDTPKHREHPPTLQLAAENLDIYYCVAKLRYVAEMKTRERLYSAHYELPMLDAVLEHTAGPGMADRFPLAAVYNSLVRLYIDGVTQAGFRAMSLLFADKFHLLPSADQQALLQHLINFGIGLGANDVDVNVEMLSLYKMAIGAGLLLDRGRITHITFVNIVSLAALCGEPEWAGSFMQTHSPYLEEGKRGAALGLSDAILCYYQGWLDRAQAGLVQDVFTTPSFDIVARGLLVKIVFDRYIMEGRDYEFLTAHLTAYEKFVNAKHLPEEKKSANLNYIRFVKKLVAVKFELVKVPEIEKEKLRQKLKLVQPIITRGWVEARIDML